MLAVRYVTLLALAVWVGGLVTLHIAGASPPDTAGRLDPLQYGCGAVIMLGLLVQKFVGPPPRAFMARMLLVSAMLIVALAARLWLPGSPASGLLGIAIGLPLLFWYARE